MTVEFFPINSPLVNYFFYKAPFISNSYVLTNLTIQSGGTGYAVNDILVLAGGTYTNPAVVRVQSVSSGGVITGVINTNAGQYTNNPTILTVGFTNGVGVGASFNNLIFSPNLLPPGPNIPLSGGFLFFYADEDHTLQLPTYSNVSDPNNPVVNTNPIQLGAAGDCGLFYLQNRFYYIVITDYTGDQANPQWTISHYNPADNGSSGNTAFNENFIVNPQFNYPITFWKTAQEDGEITQPVTAVAWGWNFQEDANTSSENFVTVENISGQGIEGSPINQILLTCSIVSSSETLKDFVQTFGTVDFLSESNITFCAQMINELGGSINVSLLLELNYGEGGSPTRNINLTSFTVTPTRQKFTFTFAMPSITGFTIGDNNYSAIHIQPALGQTCEFGMTNVLMSPGTIPLPVFVDEPKAFAKSQILGNATNLFGAGLFENYSSYYYNNGDIFPYADTGTITLQTNNSPQAFRNICDGGSLPVNGYSANNIPFRRLFDVIGNTYGGSGELIASSNGDVVTVSSGVGAREKSAWTAGNTGFTVTNTVVGLNAGISFVNNNNNTITGTFIDKFAPSQATPLFYGQQANAPSNPNNFFRANSDSSVMNYWGTNNKINNQTISISTTNPGSPSTNATFLMSFNSNNFLDYETRFVTFPFGVSTGQAISSFIEFPIFSNNVRQIGGPASISANQGIIFSVNGVIAGVPGVTLFGSSPSVNYQVVFARYFGFNFISNQSLQQNINRFINAIANPFQWTITVTVVPTAGQYFLFSDATTNFYGWFTVNGVGTDPVIPGATGVMIPIFSGNTVNDVATAIAEALNTLEFNVPAPSDLPTLAGGSKVSWYINL
jgi:hypothetical protein